MTIHDHNGTIGTCDACGHFGPLEWEHPALKTTGWMACVAVIDCAERLIEQEKARLKDQEENR